MKGSDRNRVIEALGDARMSPYLTAAGGNRKEALALYRWSVELTAAIQETLGITEVLLRNAIDRQLQEWNRNSLIREREEEREGSSATSWLLDDPAAPLRSLTRGKRIEAVRRAEKSAGRRPHNHPRHGQPVTHDDALAHTMFNMWKDILPNHAPGADPEKVENRNRVRLWEEAVGNAFPHIEDPSGEKTYWRVAHLHGLRNRVSHMDSLLNVDVLDLANDAFMLVASIDPILRNWLTGTSTVSAVHKKKPQ